MFPNLSLNDACKEQHEAVLQKGFVPKPIPTALMLIVTELSEACEADRKNRYADFECFDAVYESSIDDWGGTIHPERTAYGEAFERSIKDTFEDEIADTFLRLMDLCGAMNIDIEKHIRMKAEYNKLRPTKFGKEY